MGVNRREDSVSLAPDFLFQASKEHCSIECLACLAVANILLNLSGQLDEGLDRVL
jgi:hypothetical protein